MKRTKDVSVSYSDFLDELSREADYLRDGGTSYRKETAVLAMVVAKKARDVNPFFSRDDAFVTVSKFLSGVDEQRLKDVAKMLNVVLQDFHSKANLSEELKNKLSERAKKHKALNFVYLE